MDDLKAPGSPASDEQPPAPKRVRQNGMIYTAVQYKKGRVVVFERQTEEMLEVRRFETTPAVTGIALGMTQTIGPFESARFDVSLSLPCYVEEEAEAFAYVNATCEARLVELREETMRFRKEREEAAGKAMAERSKAAPK